MADTNTAATGEQVPSDKDPTSKEFTFALGVLLAVILTGGALAAFFYTVQFTRHETLSVLGAATAVAGAATVVGGFVGFLFGIPKTLQSDRQEGDTTRYIANTNLEQISDWLTKILVGVGLVQVKEAPDALASLARKLGPLFGDEPSSPAFGLSLAIYFAVSGFLVVYLWTRAVLQGVLKAADRDVSQQIQDVLTKREDANATALALVERQLSGQSPPTQDELNKAIAAATPEWLVQIYRRAEEQRFINWRKDPAVMERTIPVFQALAAADTGRSFFRHFGSLGFALKDKKPPAYADALAALDTAIEIRNASGAMGLEIFEWNRGLCRINLDPSFKADQPSVGTARDLILADLQVAASQLPKRMFEAGEDADATTIDQWLAMNSVTYSDLKAMAPQNG